MAIISNAGNNILRHHIAHELSEKSTFSIWIWILLLVFNDMTWLFDCNLSLTSRLAFLTVVWICFFHKAPVGFPPHWFVLRLLGLLQVASVTAILLHPLIVWDVNLLIRHWTQRRYMLAEDRWCKETLPVTNAFASRGKIKIQFKMFFFHYW